MLRALLLLFLSLSLWCILSAADISRVEYYFDDDPGAGNGIPLAFDPGGDIQIDAQISVSQLGDGLHRLFLRARDTDGKWSSTGSRIFVKNQEFPAPISRLEYFFDADPGPGNGYTLPFTGTTTVTCTVSIDASSLSNGLHVLYLRAQTAPGLWSLDVPRLVMKVLGTVTNLSAIRYYFDGDSANPFSVAPLPYQGDATHTVMEFNIDCEAANLNPGWHILHVQAENDAGYGSLRQDKIFYYVLGTAPAISRICWHFSGGDADPGLEFYLPVNPPLADVTQSLAATAVHLTQDTQYRLHMYARDARGNISQEQVLPFTADFSPNNLNLTILGSTSLLTWDQIVGATYYVVKVSEDPLAEGTPYTVTGTSYISAATAARRFYKVIAGQN